MKTFRERIKEDLHRYLMAEGRVDERLPEAEDIEGKWETITQAYLPDGIREFTGYPTVSLGWMMYVGMAVAKMWDEDWEKYSAMENLYVMLRDARGYDLMDEYVRGEVLGLEGDAYERMESLVAECASRTYSQLRHAGFEPGTTAAFHAYVDCLHQLYLMGAAVQLKAMGYKMTLMQ